MSTIKAYSYVRFSTPDQAKGDSLRRQTEAAADWCKRNGATLDTSTTFRDLGKSAFLGEHRANPERHALAAFLKLVEDGKVPRGAYLILENLDRLSREHVQPATLLALNLLQKGIRIVQLKPAEMVFDEKSDLMHLMQMMMELRRGHGESERKSSLMGPAWRQKKRQARESGAIFTRKLPAWIEVRNGKLALIQEAARAVRRIFALCNEGRGVASILRQLATDGVKPIAGASNWGKSYVHRILTNRATIGEFQPMQGRKSDRKPDGKPIPDYFPAVVSADVFNQARAALTRRTDFRRRIGVKVPSLFAGLLTDASTGSRIWIKKNCRGKHVLTAADAVESRVYGSASFPYLPFEAAVLDLLTEITPAKVLGQDRPDSESLSLATELDEMDAQLAKIEFELLEGDVATLARTARTLEAKRAALADRLAKVRDKEAAPLAAAWKDAQSLFGLAKAEPARLRLRDLLRQMIQGIYVLIVPRNQSRRLAAVQIHFKTDSGRVAMRDYLVYYLVGCNNRQGKVQHCSIDWTRGKKRTGTSDLRIPEDVKELQKELAAVNLATIFDE